MFARKSRYTLAEPGTGRHRGRPPARTKRHVAALDDTIRYQVNEKNRTEQRTLNLRVHRRSSGEQHARVSCGKGARERGGRGVRWKSLAAVQDSIANLLPLSGLLIRQVHRKCMKGVPEAHARYMTADRLRAGSR
jgi:hypothetical protein